MSLRLSGINPLAYMGVEPYTPPALVIQSAQPTANDFQNFNVGTFWLILDPKELWYLASVSGGVATWIQLYPAGGGGGGASEFICDVGTANEAAGILNVFGDTRVTTSGAGNTVSLQLSGAVPSQFNADAGTAVPSGGILNILGGLNINTSGAGDTIAINLDDNVSIIGAMGVGTNLTVDNNVTFSSLADGILQTNGAGLISATNGTDGQVLIGGGTAPLWANLTSLGGTVVITNGANTINLESSGGSGASPVAFYAYQPSTYQVPATGVIASYAPYLMGSAVAMSTLLNTGGGFYAGDGAGTPASFTAPVSGKYFFSFTVDLGQGQNPGVIPFILQDFYVEIITPTANYVEYSGKAIIGGGGVFSYNPGTTTGNATIALTAGDIVTFQTLGTNNSGAPMAGRWSYTVIGVNNPNIAGTGVITVPVTYVQGFLIEAASAGGSAISFSAYNPMDVTMTAGTIYSYGALASMTVEINEGGGFYPGDGAGTPAVFTAPVNGYYAFNMTSEIGGIGGGAQTTLVASIVGPNNTYARKHFDSQSLAGPASAASVTVSALVALNATQQVTFTVSNSIAPVNYRVRGPLAYPPSATLSVNNFITGYLVSEF